MSELDSVFSLINEHLRAAREDTPGFIPPDGETLRIIARQQTIVDYMHGQIPQLKQTKTFESPGPEEIAFFTEVIPGGEKLTLRVPSSHIPQELAIEHVGLHIFTFQGASPDYFPFAIPFAPRIFEKETTTILTIGKHMDELTRNQAEELLDNQQILRTNLQTLYVISSSVDPEKRIGKISAFPRTIIDSRIEVSNREMPLKHVRTPLTQEDITVINQGLTILETSQR